ncbi:MAG TPA: ATP-binding protein [Cyanobacteria bacterium UBA11162]|nr:ATP-binding protein [Cyanobacteria bacterium UBA12227]HAX86453.1 ATP-binding protein [Cyanobacteria bacterium UBA11370]HBL10322.1 ATP-binding protein [Cyanobacteria bacterium UBA11162]HBY76670.1 ATP-binding protein [Cyanobacteria bacterium UBA11148]
MAQIFGDFIENLPPGHDYLDIGFSASSRPIKQRWRNNRLSAYFVADYLSTFLPVDDDDPGSDRRQEECKGAVSYIANELLENAMKFHSPNQQHPVRFGIHFIEDPEVTVVLFATNAITNPMQDKYQSFIEELLASDPEELYVHQLEQSAEEENTHSSGLGLLTMINDYSAKLGWKFEAIGNNPDAIAVTTLVQVVV